MKQPEIARMDARGAIVIPSKIRKALGYSDGSLWLIEAQGQHVVLRPAMAVAVEKYSPQRRAEFILNNAIDAEDYAQAVAMVKAMGLDPQTIPHESPASAARTGPRVP